MNSSSKLLLAIGECYRRLQRHAIHLSGVARARGVKHVVEIRDLVDSFRLEEYVDAELAAGDAISWCLEITVTGTAIFVEADVRRIHSDGQDVVASIGEYQYSTEVKCSAELSEITRRLCSANPL
jgi:hypothetical protein